MRHTCKKLNTSHILTFEVFGEEINYNFYYNKAIKLFGITLISEGFYSPDDSFDEDKHIKRGNLVYSKPRIEIDTIDEFICLYRNNTMQIKIIQDEILKNKWINID